MSIPPLEAQRRWMRAAVIFPALTHATLVMLDLLGVATYQSIRHTLLADMVASPLWLPTNLAVLLALAWCRKPPEVIWALSASAAVLGAWGGLNLAVGLSASRPVSLTGPSMVLVVAVGAIVLGVLWRRSEER